MPSMTVTTRERAYDIVLERGVLNRIGDYVDLNRRVLIVTDDGVPPEYGRRVLSQCPQGSLTVVAQGEGAKSFPVFEHLCRELMRLNFSRRDLVIALGGGVIGDLAGFAAASYMRGIDFVNAPTTTLSQIDSSIGGKVAINLDGVKNIIGAFHQPCCVLADPDTLQSLTPRHYHNGLVEAVKAGLIMDPGLFELFEAGEPRDHIEEIVRRSLAVKRYVVERDEREGGLRKILNFGHTIGHGLESVYGLGGLYHGEAVALGMLPMIGDLGLRERTKRVFHRLGIATKAPFDPEAVFAVMTRDKKSDGAHTTIVRVDTLGEARLEDVDRAELKALLGRLNA